MEAGDEGWTEGFESGRLWCGGGRWQWQTEVMALVVLSSRKL